MVKYYWLILELFILRRSGDNVKVIIDSDVINSVGIINPNDEAATWKLNQAEIR